MIYNFNKEVKIILAMVMGFKYPDAIKKLVLWGGNSFITQEDVNLYKSNASI